MSKRDFLFSAGNLRCNFPIILFALNKQGKVSAPNNEIAIHRFTIRYGGQTVMELTPCTVDGIPAMHDSVQDMYFFNASKSVQIVTKNGCYSPLEVGD